MEAESRIICRNCKHALKRSKWSYDQYGNYFCALECCLPENERTPYRRDCDCCEKWEDKG